MTATEMLARLISKAARFEYITPTDCTAFRAVETGPLAKSTDGDLRVLCSQLAAL